ncbi:hypothetical protein BCV69DRAFT_282912 [Microstroma glucosiphilum]|uniref:Uncharacterized protein n=1 Tax=Pseudomicrostroma glucosiphilum TaxID=1684307 RepID=A0A316U654_9BASI|nr:hypothetical protein BCV69DRAFT_282912 [Pseudomicrostroma glucosiphilum]PWN20692.1 hypothetical protein BCV69DRAFT_282912 [Pseudomicrostroma glucosiphilum]
MSLKEIKPEAATNAVTATTSAQAANSSAPSRVLPLAASLQSSLHLLLARLGKLLKYQALLRSKICNGTATPQQLGLLPGWSDLTSAAQKWQRDVEALNRWVSEAQDALLIELSRAKKREALQAEEDAKRAEVEAAEKAKRDAEEEAQRLKKAAEDEAAAARKAAETTAEEESAKAAGAKKDATSAGGAGVIDLTDDDDVKPMSASNASTAGKHSRDEDSASAQDDSLDAKRQKTGGTSSGTDGPPATATTAGVPTPDPATLLAALTSQNSDSSTQNKNGSGDFDFSSMGNMSDLFKMDDLTNFMGQNQTQDQGQASGSGSDQVQTSGGNATGDYDGGFGAAQNGEQGDSTKLDEFSGTGGDDMDFKFDPNGFSMDGMGGSGGMDQFGSGGEGAGDMGGIDFNAALEGVDWGSLMDMIGNQGGS